MCTGGAIRCRSGPTHYIVKRPSLPASTAANNSQDPQTDANQSIRGLTILDLKVLLIGG